VNNLRSDIKMSPLKNSVIELQSTDRYFLVINAYHLIGTI